MEQWNNTDKLEHLRRLVNDAALNIGVYQDENDPEYYGITCNGMPYSWNLKFYQAKETVVTLIKGHGLGFGIPSYTSEVKFEDIFGREEENVA